MEVLLLIGRRNLGLMSNREDNFKAAVKWAWEWIENNENRFDYSFRQGVTTKDLHAYLKIQILRIEFSSGKEQLASYHRIKEFKDYESKQ